MTTFKKKLGTRIQEIRRSKNITQEKLAEIIDIDTPNLSNIERGKRFMTAETLEKIVAALNIHYKDLFDFEHNVSDNELMKKIYCELDKLSSVELKYIYKTIENIKLLRQ